MANSPPAAVEFTRYSWNEVHKGRQIESERERGRVGKEGGFTEGGRERARERGSVREKGREREGEREEERERERERENGQV